MVNSATRRTLALGMVFASATLLSVNAMAQGKAAGGKSKIVLINDSYPPFVMEAGNPLGEGMDVEIAREALKRGSNGKIEVEVKLVPWKRVLKTLEDGAADFTTSISYKKERDAFLDWSDAYRSMTTYYFYTKKGSPLKLTKLEELEGKRLGVTAGFTYPDEISKNDKIKKEDAPDIKLSMEKLLKDRTDYIVVNSVAGLWSLKEGKFLEGLEKQPYEHVSKDALGTLMAFAKKKKHAEAVKAMNAGIKSMIEDKSIEKIEQKYLTGLGK